MLVIYTASHKAYADAVLDYIDPKKTLFNYRLYRDNCLKMKLGEESVYVKDLRIFKGVDLKNIVIVDNSVLSFAFQLENGIPILPYYNNKLDNEMNTLENYLQNISQKEDLRKENKKYIKLEIFTKRSIDSSIYNSEKDTNSSGNLSNEIDENSLNILELKSCMMNSNTKTPSREPMF